jgi:hypothetical protein
MRKAVIRTLRHFDDLIMIWRTKLRWLIDLKEQNVDRKMNVPDNLKMFSFPL